MIRNVMWSIIIVFSINLSQLYSIFIILYIFFSFLLKKSVHYLNQWLKFFLCVRRPFVALPGCGGNFIDRIIFDRIILGRDFLYECTY